MRLTRAPLVLYTDDDCVVRPGALDALAAAFAAEPRAGIVLGSVRAPAYDRSAGFITAYEVRRAHTVTGVSHQARIGGIGACMAVRRSAFEALAGFDEAFGAGTALAAGEDADFIVRALVAGFGVHETPAVAVTHYGFRPWRERAAAIEGYMRGHGAAHAKLLRLGRGRAIRPLAALAWRWLARGPVADLNHVPPRLARLRAFLAGAWRGWWTPMDRATGCFLTVESDPSRVPVADDAAPRAPAVPQQLSTSLD
jgi:GT2 family glycosyltransferase